MAISRQNARSTSRRCAGAPGDFIGDRPVNACIHPAGRPINTSEIEVLRRLIESAQYTSKDFAQACQSAGVIQSMGAIGSSADNAAAEALNATFKRETLQGATDFASERQARLAVFGWAHRYNTRRRHSHLGQMSPINYENALNEKSTTLPLVA